MRVERERTDRVLLVEDHLSFRETLAYVLEEELGLSVVAQAGSLAEAREMSGDVDVAVVDLSLPDGDGVDLVRELRKAHRRCRVLALSVSLEPAGLFRAVRAGASILHKSASLSEIVSAVREVSGGATVFSPKVEEVLRAASRGPIRETRTFTRRELQVLRALAEGLENEEIARRLRMTLRTERAHMLHIFDKLGAHSRLEALVLAVRCGAVNIR